VQPCPAPYWGFRFWHALIQVLTSQLTASAGRGAKKIDSPQTTAADINASDNRRIMDDLPQIKIFEKWCAFLKTRISLSKAKPFVNGRRVT
jgi:hypothetical protein